MIPKETIDEIFDKCVIEDVIGSYLADLKKKGANYWACCPFHNEKGSINVLVVEKEEIA